MGTRVLASVRKRPLTLGCGAGDRVGLVGLTSCAHWTARRFVLAITQGEQHPDHVSASSLDGVGQRTGFNRPRHGLAVLIVSGFGLYLDGRQLGFNDVGAGHLLGGASAAQTPRKGREQDQHQHEVNRSHGLRVNRLTFKIVHV